MLFVKSKLDRTGLTPHTKQRVSERCSLRYGTIRKILNENSCVMIGVEHNKVSHRLFYSLDDDEWFIAIQDIKTGIVKTVIPVDYSRFLISNEAKEMAKKLALGKKIKKINTESIIPSKIKKTTKEETNEKFNKIYCLFEFNSAGKSKKFKWILFYEFDTQEITITENITKRIKEKLKYFRENENKIISDPITIAIVRSKEDAKKGIFLEKLDTTRFL